MKAWIVALPFRRQFVKACLWALIVIAFFSGGRALLSYDDATSLYLSVSLKSPQEGISALYYDVGKGYNESRVVSVFLKGDNQFYDYLYKIPKETLYHLRWDPPPAMRDPITIEKIEILDSSQRLVKRLNLRQLVPLHQIQTLELSADQADIRVQEGANDPQVEIRLESPIIVKKYQVLAQFLGKLLLEFTGVFLSACLMIYVWFQWIIALPSRRQFVKACLWALIVIAFLSGWRALMTYDDAASLYLSISLKSPQEGISALYYDVGKGYNDGHVVSAFVRGDNRVYDYLYKIPNKALYHLRWDPPPAMRDPIVIRKIEILDSSHRLVKRLNLRQLAPLNQIQALELSADQADIRAQEGANDPQVEIRLESPIVVNNLQVLAPFLDQLLIGFIGFFLGACLMIYVWFQWRAKKGAWFRQKSRVMAAAIVIYVLFFGWRCWVLYDDAGYLFLEVAMNSSVNSNVQIYYDLGQGLNENHSYQLQVASREDLHQYRFKLPNKTIYKIRFDPLTTAGRVWIGKMNVTDAFGNILREISLKQLEPINQIKSIDPREDGIEIVVAENANDPQIVLSMKEALDFEGKLPFPLGQWLLAVLAELGWFVLFAFVLVWGWRKKWGKLILEGIETPFFQEKMPLLYFGTALGMILAMGMISGLDVNPDEWNGHVKAAAYYMQNWLPPAVDDPRIVSSISVFGVSYLWHIDPYYFIAVKATQVLSGIVSDFYLRVRLANAFLFLLLILIFALQIKRSKWLVPFIVISPQVWYVFSYFNNDAFPLFIAMILGLQVVDSESLLNRYITSPTMGHHVRGGILMGILIGLLLSSKLNYRIYIAFLIFAGLWGVLFEASVPQRVLRLKKGIFLFIVALLVYLPLYGYDQYVNDFKKDEKGLIAMERYAAPQFKPSTMQGNLSSSYPGLRLKEKGISLQELLIDSSDWRDLSFKSFFGLYGYMDLVSSEGYYLAVTSVLIGFFLIVFSYVVFALPVRDFIFILFVLLFSGLVVGQSVYHSWVNDYEPQGRYLFPILPMLMIGLAKLPTSFRLRVMPVFGLTFFLLSVWSFLLTGLRMIPKID